MKSIKTKPISISVVIPTYNAAQWLPKTIPRVETALERLKPKNAEIVIVDDGSSDGSGEVAENLKTKYPIRVVRQKNSGRFLARKVGTEQAKFEYILFIDTRIYISPNGLKFIAEEMTKHPERKVWTSHVYLDKEANMYARFWDALTMIAWRKYFKKPRDYSYGLKEFDYFPKGTTCFFVPKVVFDEANQWFIGKTKDLKTSNDDTLLIRHIANKQNININPEFSCIYHARSSLKQYIKHVFHRGKVFIDGFLRRDGNRFFWPLVGFLIASVLVLAGLILNPEFIIPLLFFAFVLWAVELLLAMTAGIPKRDAWSLVILSPIFAIAYGAGIWAAFLKLHVAPLFMRSSEKA